MPRNGDETTSSGVMGDRSVVHTASGSLKLAPVLRVPAFFPRARWRWCRIMAVLFALSVLVFLACLHAGAEAISVRRMIEIATGAIWSDLTLTEEAAIMSTIVLQVRLPRLLVGFMVGACLAAVGAALQALLRNPLADPYVLGISSGAALGAAVGMILRIAPNGWASLVSPMSAFLGGLLAIGIVYRIAVTDGRLPVHALLLAGVIMNAMLSALILFVTSVLDPTGFFRVMSWLMGTLNAPDYPILALLTALVGIGLFGLMRTASALNLLSLGEESALSLGLAVEPLKKTVFVLSALLTGTVVSMSGMIGFVGMVIPHALRITVGADHRLLLPASALVGGCFLMVCDTVARTAFAPTEIPVGVVTALIGGPVFVYLLARRTIGFRAVES